MSKRRKSLPRLAVRSHGDCIILMNAVREHCKARVDEYQYHIGRLFKEGEEKRAREVMGWRDQVFQCGQRTMARLEQIKARFEAEIEYNDEPDKGDSSNGCPGDVGARDSY